MTRAPVTRGDTSRARRLMVVLLSVGAILRGYAYGFHQGAGGPALDGGAVTTLGLSPVTLGALWIAAGLLGIWSVIVSRWLWAVAVIGGMWVVWGLGYAWGWISGDGRDTDWISTGTYLLTGLAFWTVTRQPDVGRTMER